MVFDLLFNLKFKIYTALFVKTNLVSILTNLKAQPLLKFVKILNYFNSIIFILILNLAMNEQTHRLINE